MVPSTSGVYFTTLFIQEPGLLSRPFLLPLTPSSWVIATTHIHQLQMKEALQLELEIDEGTRV